MRTARIQKQIFRNAICILNVKSVPLLFFSDFLNPSILSIYLREF